MNKSFVLILSVKNVIDLESGKSRENVFNIDGGTIGSGANNHWILQDIKGSIPVNQANIEWRDNAFCLQVIGKSLLVNSATFTPKSGFIRLKDGDQIKCGALKLAVSVTEKDLSTERNSLKKVEDIVTENQDYLDEILKRKESSHLVTSKDLADTVDNNIVKDPIVALHPDSNNIASLRVDENAEHLLSRNNNLKNELKTN